MKTIEDEIFQKKFRNEYQKVQLNILFTAGWLAGHLAHIFKKYGITGQQYNVLRIIKGSHPLPCSIQMIRERMLDRMSDTSRIVERLNRLGFISRVVNATDRRSVHITISEKGNELLERMKEEEANIDSLVSTLTEEEAGQLSMLLDKIRNK